jgi:hypothetical protein
MQGGARTNAGRPQGSRNKRTLAVLDKLESAAPDYCPIAELAKIAQDPETPLNLRIDCHKTIASYTVPKIKPFETIGFERENGIKEDWML